ncbi:MAG: O-antigen ligase family protein [Anaerolineales bacterium]|nr:O-antigen ligase family protein [Anaerolineales bacterium]
MRWLKVPFLVLVTGLAALVAASADFEFFGFSASGYAWLLPLVAALLVLARYPTRVHFPIWIWVPWALLLLAYLTQAEEPHAMQRTVMMLCPLAVGMAASCARATPTVALATLRFVKPLAVALLLAVVWGTGLLLSGTLPSYGGYAASVMTAALLGAVLAAEYSSGRRASLIWWGAIQLVPLIALTRTGIVASALTLPLCLGRVRLRTRLLSLGAIALGGIALFSSPRMQARMFYSGSGTFSDISLQNRNFATSGRSALWPELVEEIKKRPWLGHGANASETYVSTARPGLAHPHNDWLRLLYDYGVLGTVLFVLTLLTQVFHTLASARRAPDPAHVLFIGAASSFIVLTLFMFTDNIILYAAFFGNLQFAFLGTAYGSTSRRKKIRSLAEPIGNHGSSEHRARTNTNVKLARGSSDSLR